MKVERGEERGGREEVRRWAAVEREQEEGKNLPLLFRLGKQRKPL